MFLKKYFGYKPLELEYFESDVKKIITDEEINKTVEETQKNIIKVINKISNIHSVIVESNNVIIFKKVKFVNTSGTIEINQKNAVVLLIDTDFNDEMTDNINIETETTFYNNIIESLHTEDLEAINKELESKIKDDKSTSIINDIKNYTEIKNKDYINILNEIHNTIESYGFNEIINKCIASAEQYNYINIDDVQFGGSSYLTKEDYENKKSKVDLLFNQENTTELIIKCITDNKIIFDMFNNVLSNLEINKDSDVHIDIDPKDPEEKPEEPKIEPVIEPEPDEPLEPIIEDQPTEPKHATFKDILKEPLIYVSFFIILFIIFFITFLFYKNK